MIQVADGAPVGVGKYRRVYRHAWRWLDLESGAPDLDSILLKSWICSARQKQNGKKRVRYAFGASRLRQDIPYEQNRRDALDMSA